VAEPELGFIDFALLANNFGLASLAGSARLTVTGSQSGTPQQTAP
jgi:hypothetical protein